MPHPLSCWSGRKETLFYGSVAHMKLRKSKELNWGTELILFLESYYKIKISDDLTD
jgi:hypothetical protein